jgi:predicted nucleic acid-binding protein
MRHPSYYDKSKSFLHYSLAEPHEALLIKIESRKRAARTVEDELKQLSRSKSYVSDIENLRKLAELLIRSGIEETQRLRETQAKILSMASIIPLTKPIFLSALNYENQYNLAPQDAIVYASIMDYLVRNSSIQSVFLNKNRKDFQDTKGELSTYNCQIFFNFQHGYDYIVHQLPK